MANIEIIEFQIPTNNRKNLFVTNIPVNRRETDIFQQLDIAFSKYGLLHEIQVFTSSVPKSNGQHNESAYGFVKFYSSTAARKAKEELNDVLTIDGHHCKITYAKRRNAQTLSQPLHLSKCVELANFYLGFNGWSSKINKLEEDKDVPPVNGIAKTRFFCVLTLSITNQNLSCDGLGAWEESYQNTDPMNRIGVMAKTKKLALQRAMENAFSKLLIIVLNSGKISVEENTTLTDPFLKVNHVDDAQLLKVTELNDEPVLDSDDENVDDLDADLDGANLQVLQELEDI